MTEQTATPAVEEVLDQPTEKQEVTLDELNALRGQIEEATKNAESARVRAEMAEQERDQERKEAAQRLAEETAQRSKAQENSIEVLIKSTKTEAEQIEKDMQRAAEDGRFDDYTKLTAEYSRKIISIDRYENQKEQFDKAKEIKSQPKDPLADFTPRTKEWITKHPQFLSDSRYNTRALGAHSLAISDGLKPDTDEYFAYIENIIEPKKAEEKIETQEKAEHKQSASSTAAPVSRTSAGSSSSQPMRLSVDQVDHALAIYPHLSPADAQKIYWDNMQELKKKGKL